MQRSSETIGAIAAALAKAQAELTNPEKALIATIRTSNPREQGQTFRYAALSSGLDIVRKALGGHEIATVQTTAIDKEAGLIRLNTTLAHSSGEWLSSEWPVCAIGETAAPRRMGAALTYARRYALFTLVGIAGEDDLDAPDLNLRVEPVSKADAAHDVGEDVVQPIQSSNAAGQRPTANSTLGRREKAVHAARALLGAEQSVALRDKLLVDITQLESEDEAADWVHKNLPSKNALATADADLVESAFRDRLATIESTSPAAESAFPNADAGHDTVSGQAFVEPMEASTAAQIILPQKPAGRRVAAKTIRLRDKEHSKFVTTQPCVVCGRMPSEAHHIRFAQPRALGRKVSDEYTVPVCRLHHRELHRYGDEASWWAGVGVDPVPIALELWRRSQSGDPHRACALPPTADENAP
jgi:hypothetical protein